MNPAFGFADVLAPTPTVIPMVVTTTVSYSVTAPVAVTEPPPTVPTPVNPSFGPATPTLTPAHVTVPWWVVVMVVVGAFAVVGLVGSCWFIRRVSKDTFRFLHSHKI